LAGAWRAENEDMKVKHPRNRPWRLVGLCDVKDPAPWR
jgi:hypothetical protein